MTEREHAVPEDLVTVASRLAALGEADRRRGDQVAARVAMRTAHCLREERGFAPPMMSRLRAWLLWLAVPAGVGAALLVAVATLRPGAAQQHDQGPGVLAANLARDIDAWAELDTMWHDDEFETDLAVLSLEAAGVATKSEELSPIPALDAGL